MTNGTPGPATQKSGSNSKGDVKTKKSGKIPSVRSKTQNLKRKNRISRV